MSAFVEVRNLRIELGRKKKVVAVNNVSFNMSKNQCLVMIGESGSGKSTLLKSFLGLLSKREANVGGRVQFAENELLSLSEKQMSKLRGNDISMVFQGAMSVLDPVYSVGDQITEALRKHRKLNRKEASAKALELLRLVGIPSPEQRMKAFPHEMSGGMRQRIMIAIALACQPRLLLADEPTTALDVTIQAQILTLLRQLQQELEMSVILVTHDIGVASTMADLIGVMYAGKIVEFGKASEVLANPAHPYTLGLIAANEIPERFQPLYSIPGHPPDLADPPAGCAFADRCSFVMEKCRTSEPKEYALTGERWTKCFYTEAKKRPLYKEAAEMDVG